MPNVKEVARYAGVSVASVSRTLSGYPHVSPEVRERVMRAVEELGYRPDRIARSLRLRRTNLIGLCVSSIETVFFTEMARAAEQAAHKHGYNLILCNTEEDPQQERIYLDLLDRQLVTGVILSPAPGEALHLDAYVERGLPIILVNRRIDRLACSSITSNEEEITYDCVTRLIQEGRRRIAAITGFSEASTTKERLRGYRQALRDAGLDPHDSLEECGWSDLKGGYAAAYKLVQSDQPPDALIAFNDLMTQGSIMALQDLGLRWPEVIDVAGFGAFAVAHLYNPPLTLIDQPSHDMGSLAVKMLIDQVENGSSHPQRVVLKNHIISRQEWRAWRHPDLMNREGDLFNGRKIITP